MLCSLPETRKARLHPQVSLEHFTSSHIPGGAATGLLGFGFELQLWVSTWGDFAPQPHGIQHRLQTFWVVTAGGQGDVPDIYQVVTRDDAT